MSDATCIAAHDDDPPQALPGLRLCQRHHTRLARDLTDIVTLWQVLDELLIPGTASGSGHRGKPGSRPACDLDVADLLDPRGAVSATLVGWARVVIEDRRLAARTLDAEQAARLLVVHLDWLCAQPFADEVAAEIHSCAHAVRRACRDLPDPPIGTCPDIDPRGESDTCGGPLRWMDDGTMSVVCGRCGSGWRSDDLPHILRVVQPTRRFPVPRAWVVARYGVTGDALRQWVRRGHVKTYTDEQVELFDVLARITDTPTSVNE